MLLIPIEKVTALVPLKKIILNCGPSRSWLQPSPPDSWELHEYPGRGGCFFNRRTLSSGKKWRILHFKNQNQRNKWGRWKLCFWMLRRNYVFLTVTSKLLYQLNNSLCLWSGPFFLPKLKANGNVSAKYSHFKRKVSWCFDVSNTSSVFLHRTVHSYLGFLIAFKSMPPFSKASGRFTPHLQLFGPSVIIDLRLSKCCVKTKTSIKTVYNRTGVLW